MIGVTLRLFCDKCASVEVDLGRNGIHIEARCGECGNHIKFVSKKLVAELGLELTEIFTKHIPYSEESSSES